MSETVRINKYLSEAGVCSRREADRRIRAGLVTINGRIAVFGDQVSSGDRVMYNGAAVTREEEMILLAVNKPTGVVCTAEKREKNNIVDYINYPKRIYPIGRLDKDSHGLLLMTNQGELVNKIMRSRYYHEKEYIVKVYQEIDQAFIQGMAKGVYLKELDAYTRPCRVEKVGKRTFRIVLTQGMNRQIRRMCEVFGHKVMDLKRVRIMNICLGDLKEGAYRKVSKKEWRELLELLQASGQETSQEEEAEHEAARSKAGQNPNI